MRRLRFHLTGRPRSGLRDCARALEEPEVWDADGLRVEFFLSDLEDRGVPFAIETIESLTLEIRAKRTGNILLTGPVTAGPLTPCTLAEWDAGTGIHGSFQLTGQQMNFVNGTAEVWMSVRATIAGGEPVTFGAGRVKISESQHGSSSDPVTTTAGGFLYVDSETPTADGSLIVTFRGRQFRLNPIDYPSNLAEPPASNRLVLPIWDGDKFVSVPFDVAGQNGRVLGVSGGAWAMFPGGGDALTASPLSQFSGGTTPAQLRNLINGHSGTGDLLFRHGNIGSATAEALRIGFVDIVPPVAGSGHPLTFMHTTAGQGVRIYAQPNDWFSDGPKVKWDDFGDPFLQMFLPNGSIDPLKAGYRVMTRMFYDGASPSLDGSELKGVNGKYAMALKSALNTYGIWTVGRLGHQDDSAAAGGVIQWYYFDSEDDWHENFIEGCWRQGLAVTDGEEILWGNNLYEAENTGTTGGTPPTHAAGTVSDGGINWTWKRDYANSAAQGWIIPTVMIGDGTLKPWPRLRDTRLQLNKDTAIWNGQRVRYLNNAGVPIWNTRTNLNGTDWWIECETVANARARFATNASRAFFSLNNIARVLVPKAGTNNSTTIDIAGAEMVTLNYSSATDVTGTINGLGRQPFSLLSGNGNVTLKHGSGFTLIDGEDYVMRPGEVLNFMMDGSTPPVSAVQIESKTRRRLDRGLAVGSAGHMMTGIFTGTAVIDFPSINAGNEATANIAVTGALTAGTPTVELGWGGELEAGIIVAQKRVSANGVVTIRVRNVSGAPIDPAPITCRAKVTQF